MKYLLITTSLIDHMWEIRKEQYNECIKQAIFLFKPCGFKIVIIENNNNTTSFLDCFKGDADILYTNTNLTSPLTNIGFKELTDVRIFLTRYNIGDEDFIVKLTGRYFVTSDAPFLGEFDKGYDAICRYGGPNGEITAVCACGLIGLSGKLFKQVELPKDNTISVETNYATAINTYATNKCILPALGLMEAPSHYGMTNYKYI